MIDTSRYEGKRRGILDEYSAQRATNDYSRFLAQQRGTRNIADLQRSFGRSQPRFTAAWARRGMAGPAVQSGSFQRALQRRAGDFQRDLGQAQSDLNQSLTQYDLGAARLDAWRQQAMADLEMQKQAEIANAALHIQALRNQF